MSHSAVDAVQRHVEEACRAVGLDVHGDVGEDKDDALIALHEDLRRAHYSAERLRLRADAADGV